MDATNFGFKSLEKVRLKATENMEINGVSFKEGETILYFDSIDVAGWDETVTSSAAFGGFDNRPLVVWENPTNQSLQFAQGIMSATSLAVLSNSKVANRASTSLAVTWRESLDSADLEEKSYTLKYEPIAGSIYVYDASNGGSLPFTVSGKVITISATFTTITNIIIDYRFLYTDGEQIFEFGNNLYTGFYQLEGLTKVKDDNEGTIKTGVIIIPRLKLMSNLSVRLGKNGSPFVSNFTAMCLPVGSRGNTKISEIHLLSTDLESDT